LINSIADAETWTVSVQLDFALPDRLSCRTSACFHPPDNDPDLMLLHRMRDGSLDYDVLGILSTFPTPVTPRDIYFHDMASFAHHRRRLDIVLIEWVMSIPGNALGRELRYTSTEGDLIVISRGKLALHLFMHQLHHRGQLTTLFSQLSLDYGCTDMPVIVPEGLGALGWEFPDA
jgi:hypothetical protein